MEDLIQWCGDNNVIQKTEVDPPTPPLYISRAAVETVPSVRYFGVHLSNALTWCTNTTAVIKKARQHLYFLKKLKRAGKDADTFRSFYSCVVESVLTSSLTVPH